jgi:hypothetical protein
MKGGSAPARITPYEVGIPGRQFATRVFADIRAEAAARSVDPTDPGAFLLLGEAGRAIREIQGEERGGDSVHYLGAFLFHCLHFSGAGEPLFVLEEDVARKLAGVPDPVGVPDLTVWKGDIPTPAGYLQLPRNLFWSDAGAADAPEPLDGVFWTRSVRDTLSLLVALGMRAGRPGFSLVEIPPAPRGVAVTWPHQAVREEGEDFGTTLPGGELGGLYSVTTVGEVQKLMGRIFAYLAASPNALGKEERTPKEVREAGPASLSALAYRRIAGAT